MKPSCLPPAPSCAGASCLSVTASCKFCPLPLLPALWAQPAWYGISLKNGTYTKRRRWCDSPVRLPDEVLADMKKLTEVMKEKNMSKKWILTLLLAVSLVLASCGSPATQAPAEPAAQTEAPAPAGEQVTLTIESWRNDDLPIWQDVIIPAFEGKFPNINVEFNPTAPAEYNGVLNTKLEGGTAGDLITCRPFDASLKLFQSKYLASLNDLSGMENFGDVAKSAWITDDNKDVFCVPMASVIHGFFYNKDIFDKYGLKEPATRDEFFALLQTLKDKGETPLVMGTSDQWESATMGFQNIGPNYWKGEEGRLALIKGTAKFTDAAYIQTWQDLADWKPFLPEGFEAVKYPDSQSLFTLGKGVIYPTGSWEISQFEKDSKFKLGIFPPYVQKASD